MAKTIDELEKMAAETFRRIDQDLLEMNKSQARNDRILARHHAQLS